MLNDAGTEGNRGLLFVLSAPAGTGKTTVVERLMEAHPRVQESVSLTTRPPRPTEEEGTHYHFLSESAFLARVDQGEFLEHVEVFGHRYGTSKLLLEEQQRQGFHVVLTIDTQGAMQIKKKVPAVFVFLQPPSMEELSRRLRDRKTETAEAVNERLAWSEKEMAEAGEYDYIIVNDSLETTVDVFKSIVVAEEHRVRQ